jgi:hypothetical protein
MHDHKSIPKPEEGIPGQSSNGEQPLCIDGLFELLSNQRRRYVLYYLWKTEGAAKLGEVAEQIAAWELGTSTREVPADKRKSVYTSLQQFHLTKMDEKNVIDFEKRDGTIELDCAADNVKNCLESINNSTDEYRSNQGILSQMSLGALFR